MSGIRIQSKRLWWLVGIATALVLIAAFIWMWQFLSTPKPPDWLALPAGYEVQQAQVIWAGDGFEGPDTLWVLRSPDTCSATAAYVRAQSVKRFGTLVDTIATPDMYDFHYDGGTRQVYITVRTCDSGSEVLIKETIGL